MADSSGDIDSSVQEKPRSTVKGIQTYLLSMLFEGVTKITYVFDWMWIRRSNYLRYFTYSAIFSVSSSLLAVSWLLAWQSGPEASIRGTLLQIDRAVVGLNIPLLSVLMLFGVACGLLIVFPLDEYKRYEGWYVLGGFVTMVVVGLRGIEGRFSLADAIPELAFGGGVGFLVGFAVTHHLSISSTGSEHEYRDSFVVLKWLVVGVGLLGVIYSVSAAESLVSIHGSTAVLGLAAVVGHYWVFERFTTYTNVQDIFLLGPERAGKTYFVAGIAFTLTQDRSQRHLASPVSLENDATEKLFTKFQNAAFDDIGTTDAHDVNVYELSFTTDGIFTTDLRFRVPDYDGKDIPEIENKIDSLENTTASELRKDLPHKFKDKTPIPNKSNGLFDSIRDTLTPSISSGTELDDFVKEVNDTDRLDDKDNRISILTYFLLSSETIFCMLPMDDFDDGINDGTLPDYWNSVKDSASEAGDEKNETDRNSESESGGERDDEAISVANPRMDVWKYESVYTTVCQNLNEKDISFLLTKADGFRESFDGDSNENPRDFREFVVKQFVRNRPAFGPATHLDFSHWTPHQKWVVRGGEVRLRDRLTDTITGPPPYIPVYIRPDPSSEADFRPDVGSQVGDLVWGLDHLLKRIQ